MTKEELEKIRDKSVGIKVFEILYNGFKALFEKEFGPDNESIELGYKQNLNDFDWMENTIDFYRNEKFIPPEYLCEAGVRLTDYAIGKIFLGYDFKENLTLLKQAKEIEKFPETKRVTEFEYFCKDKKCEYEIFFYTKLLKKFMTNEIYKIGKGVFRMLEITVDYRKLDILLSFDSDFHQNTNSFLFTVFFRDCEDFLECLRQFTDNCLNKNLKTNKEIKKEIEALPLKEYKGRKKFFGGIENENKNRYKFFKELTRCNARLAKHYARGKTRYR